MSFYANARRVPPEAKQKVKEDFNLSLSKKGLKPTLQRNLIPDAFTELGRPTDATVGQRQAVTVSSKKPALTAAGLLLRGVKAPVKPL